MRNNWKTPKRLYQKFIDAGFFDPCPPDPTFDGLTAEWGEKTFCNPPYNENAKWIDKALEEAKKGKKIVLLIPSRTDTKYFHKLTEFGARIIFFTGRLHFDDRPGSPPFASMLVGLNYGQKNTFTTTNAKQWGLKDET